jgi:CelD/BcsL family acetyltransferase involved in cellulose biosynthesis
MSASPSRPSPSSNPAVWASAAQPDARRMRVETYERLEPIAHEWDDLADRTNAPPWLRPGWIGAWWQAFGAGRLELLAVRRAGRLAGLVPLHHRAGVLSSMTNSHTPEFGVLAEDRTVAQQLAEALFVRAACLWPSSTPKRRASATVARPPPQRATGWWSELTHARRISQRKVTGRRTRTS